MKVKFERTDLVRRISVFEVDVASVKNVDEWIEADFVAVDEHVLDFGTLLHERYEAVDEHDLTLRVIKEEA